MKTRMSKAQRNDGKGCKSYGLCPIKGIHNFLRVSLQEPQQMCLESGGNYAMNALRESRETF